MPDMSDALALNVQYPVDRTAVVTVAGDLDLHTAHALRERALAVVEQGAPHLILDLAQVDFFDSTGLSTLITLLHTTRQASGSLRLAQIPKHLMQMVTVTGIAQLLPIHATVTDALADRAVDGPFGGTDEVGDTSG
jgi:anti-sigma B factor antagonist